MVSLIKVNSNDLNKEHPGFRPDRGIGSLVDYRSCTEHDWSLGMMIGLGVREFRAHLCFANALLAPIRRHVALAYLGHPDHWQDAARQFTTQMHAAFDQGGFDVAQEGEFKDATGAPYQYFEAALECGARVSIALCHHNQEF